MKNLSTYLAIVYWAVQFVDARKNSENIHKFIFKDYNKLFRPVKNESEVVNVLVRFLPRGINEFDEVEGKISLILGIDIRWNDAFLKWNLTDFGFTPTLLLPDSQIWTPSLALANPIDRMILFPEDKFKVRVFFNGSVILIKGGTIRATCQPDVMNYPFDVHDCSVKIFPMDEIIREVLLHAEIRMHIFDNFGPWELFNEKVYSTNLDIFSLVVFSFSVKRRPEFSLLSICVPVLLIGILNACVFLIPPASGERISYAITVLLSLVVFMTIVSASMPKNSDPVPILSYILLSMMIESGVVVFLTIYGLRLHFRSEDRPIPIRLKVLATMYNKRRHNFGRNRSCYNAASVNASGENETSPANNNTNNASENRMSSISLSNIKQNRSVRNHGTEAERGEQHASWRDVGDMYDKVCFWLTFAVFAVTAGVYFICLKVHSATHDDHN